MGRSSVIFFSSTSCMTNQAKVALVSEAPYITVSGCSGSFGSRLRSP